MFQSPDWCLWMLSVTTCINTLSVPCARVTYSPSTAALAQNFPFQHDPALDFQSFFTHKTSLALTFIFSNLTGIFT